jgi:hypothetical protein
MIQKHDAMEMTCYSYCLKNTKGIITKKQEKRFRTKKVDYHFVSNLSHEVPKAQKNSFDGFNRITHVKNK